MFKGLIDLMSNLLSPNKSDNIKGQAVRQIISGLTATLCDLAIFQLGLSIGINIFAAALISMTISTVVNFTITRYYVYSQVDRQKRAVKSQFLLYIFTVLVSVGLTQLILLIFSINLGFDPMLVKIGSVPFIYLWTLLSGKYIVFSKTINSFFV
jgi:putative flippase GtrA